jgi:uncharacterized protein YbjT (DUF2867 family)
MGEAEAKVALLAGASGLVGGEVLGALLEAPDFQRVYAVSRRPLGREHARLANRIVQFDRLESQLKGLTCHTAFCCLGSPAGGRVSEQEVRQIEYAYVLAFARAAKASQAQRFVLLSCARVEPGAATADLMAKHDVEEAITALGFAAVDILKPGPLLGLRKQVRVGDLARTLVMPVINPLLTGAREAHRGISARTVAAAMLGASRSGRRGVYQYTYGGLLGLASAKPQSRPGAQTSARANKGGQAPR